MAPAFLSDLLATVVAEHEHRAIADTPETCFAALFIDTHDSHPGPVFDKTLDGRFTDSTYPTRDNRPLFREACHALFLFQSMPSRAGQPCGHPARTLESRLRAP